MKKYLLLTMLIIAITILVSACSSDDSGTANDTANTNDNGNGNGAIDNAETEETRLYPNLPDTDLGGFEIHFLARDQSTGSFGNIDIFAESENGDPVNDAVYQRNQTLMEKYNFTIKYTPTTDSANTPATVVKTSILANEDIYHVVYDGLTLLSPLAAEKYLLDFNSLDNIDFTQPWWDEEANNDLSLVNKLYFTYGEHMLGPKSGLYCIFFNKLLADNYNLGDLYQYVYDDNWNWNTFYELAKGVSQDMNNNGKNDLEDMYGFVTETYNGYTAMIGGGIKIAEKDSNDIPQLSMNTEKALVGVDNMLKVFGDKTITVYPGDITGTSDVWGEFWRDCFLANQMLFREGAMHDVPSMRNMDADFGILPMPKLFPDQDRYYHTNSVWNAQIMSLPVTISELDKVTFIIEAMACESMYLLTPAYYEIQLLTKVSRDNESAGMLDIIFNSKTFDIGAVYQWGSLINIYTGIASSRTNNFASAYASAEQSAETAMQKTIDAFSE